MAKSCSFDIVSKTDMMEVENAVNQAMAEIAQRFDFKNSKSKITLDGAKNEIVLIADDEHKLKSVIDIIQGRLVKRKISLKALDYGVVEPASGDTVRQTISLQQGIATDKGKEVVKFLKGLKIKIQGQIMDNQVRVTGKNRDDLQEAIQELKAKDFGIAMTFENYR